jgi:hypothetical protein
MLPDLSWSNFKSDQAELPSEISEPPDSLTMRLRAESNRHRAPPRLRISPLRIAFEHQIRFTPAEPANPVNFHRDLMRLLSPFVAIRAGTVTCGIHDPAPRRKRIRGSAHHLVSTLGVGFHAGNRRTTGTCSNDSNCHCVSHATSGPFARILPHRAKRAAIAGSPITQPLY